MKKVALVVLIGLGVVGCSTTGEHTAPTFKLKGYNGPEAMDRNEVVQASKQCLFAKMKPNVEFVSAKTDSGKVLVPVNVHCQPY